MSLSLSADFRRFCLVFPVPELSGPVRSVPRGARGRHSADQGVCGQPEALEGTVLQVQGRG